MLVDKSNELGVTNIQLAMKQQETQQVVQKYIANEGIKLRHHESNEQVFAKQMSKIGQNGMEAAEDSDDDMQEDLLPEDALLVS